MNDDDWIELLEHLIKGLIEIGAADTADEVRQAASTRVIEESLKTQEYDLQLSASSYRELGSVTTRLPTPREAFTQALVALKIRLQTLPNLGVYISRALNADPEKIVWKAESQKYEFLSSTSDLSASKFILSSDARASISELLNKLDILIQQA